MFDWQENNTVKITPTASPKKLTGTRFAAIFGLNTWSTPFEIWCEVTRTYEKPFEDTIYTLAGKAIEPKQLNYCRKTFFMNVLTPTEMYGENYFDETHGDFFPANKIFGGMWDGLVVNKNGKPVRVIECKTTKRAEDWEGSKIPEYYALQAALYAYLVGVNDVLMVASFLEESDYKNPENYTPSVKNTILVPFKVNERYPNFDLFVDKAIEWWDRHVKTGISPAYDEKKDEEILKALRTKFIDTSMIGLSDMVSEIESLTDEINTHNELIADKEARLKNLKEALSKEMKKTFNVGDKSVKIDGKKYLFTVTKSTSEGVDKDKIIADGLFDRHKKTTEKYTLTVKEKKGE